MSQPYASPVGEWQPPAPPQAWQHPLPRPPKPERPLRPAVWWSVAINAIYSLGSVLMIVVFGAFLLAIFSGASSGELGLDLESRETALLVAGLLGIFVVSLLVGLGMTVGALLLLRMGSSFRTFPSFVQALLAALCAFVVANVVGTAFGFVAQLASSTPAVFGQ